jgi:methyl-accepting chemotaxis protein
VTIDIDKEFAEDIVIEHERAVEQMHNRDAVLKEIGDRVERIVNLLKRVGATENEIEEVTETIDQIGSWERQYERLLR